MDSLESPFTLIASRRMSHTTRLPRSIPRLLIGAWVLLLGLAACVRVPRSEDAGAAVLTGTVTYLPRIALPPDAVVRVRLEDVSRADAAAVPVAEQTIPTSGRQVPIPFRLTYGPGRIERGHRYAVRAEIRGGDGELLWTTDRSYPVRTAGAPADSVEIRMVQPRRDPAPGSPTAAPLVGPTWRLVRIEVPNGAAITPAADTPFTTMFGADGRYAGRADCNRYGGEYRVEGGGRLVLARGLASLAACPSPAASDAFFGVLNAVDGFVIAGDELRLTTRAGGALVFQRAAE